MEVCGSGTRTAGISLHRFPLDSRRTDHRPESSVGSARKTARSQQLDGSGGIQLRWTMTLGVAASPEERRVEPESESSRSERGKHGETHPKNPSTGGGCETTGPRGDADETLLDEGNPSRRHSETSSPSQNDTGCWFRPNGHKKKRLRGVSYFQSDSDSRSGPNASNRDRRLSARNSRKSSSRPGESKRQDTFPKEPSIQRRNASNRLGGDTSKSTLDAETTKQSRSDEKSCRESPRGRKSGVKPSHSFRAFAARREDCRQNAGALLDNSSISTKYPGFHEYVLGSRLKLRREIKSCADIKPELSDCGFEKTVESGDQGFSGESGTENSLGVVGTPAWTSVTSPAVRPRLSRDQRGLRPLKTLFLAAEELLRKASGDDLP
ncbi:hypothetical protein HPB47_013309 [Ixodes persulcatus]|uniref:Uncharacterized protein n=1 Tax=Ixodes persulcatus TaxID=34615 RepID=A0AC60R1I4_IXOPE|nr:hypothetical protein HPB47_013309 [Ixodes persulcatus]